MENNICQKKKDGFFGKKSNKDFEGSEETKNLFIKQRAELWDKLFKEKEKKLKSLPRQEIKITLLDGKEIKGISNVTTPYNIAEKYLKNPKLKDLLVSKIFYSKKISEITTKSLDEIEQEENCSKTENISFELWDMHRPLIGDCKIEFCDFETNEGKNTFWHSSSHLLGSAIEQIYGSKICNGKALKKGFYYDSFMGNNTINPEKDFNKIENTAKKISNQNHFFTRLILTKKEGLELFKDNSFKIQLISNKLKEDELTTAYRCGDFIDLCPGPHIPNLNMIKALKITKNSASNWLGKITNFSLQRIYGISFPNDKLLKEYIKIKEEEEKKDHRYLGKQQGLFMFHILSPGSCFWFQPGTYIYNKLMSFLRNQYKICDYQEIITPNIYNLKLWKTSGHYQNFKNNMFLMKVENHGFGLKPVNCPTACLIFDSTARSYKELPLRLADFGVLHRNDISGAITGLIRAKRFQMDDVHIFCRYDQIMDEVLKYLDFMSYIYEVFGFKYELYLSTRPPKMIGNEKLWDMAEKNLIDALNKFGKPWKFNPGHGAFYGPKIDITLIDSLGRSFKCSSTLQLDFQLPIRFNLKYKNEDEIVKKDKEKLTGGNKIEGKEENSAQFNEYGESLGREIYKKDEWDDEEFKWEEKPLNFGFSRPCIIHRAIIFSVERFSALLLEHFSGKLPFWLSPKQICICTVNNRIQKYAEKWYLFLNYKGYQVHLDNSSSTLKKKIRNAQIAQYKFIGVIGQEEVNDNLIDIRTWEGKILGKYTMNKLLEFFQSLEPKKSNAELNLLEKIYKDAKNKEKYINEERLNYNLFLNGDVCSEEDIILYQTLKNEDIDKMKFPNLFKWKKLMSIKK